MPRHSRRQANAAVRCTETRNVAGVHTIAAVESHKVRHMGTVKMSAFGLRVLPHIDIGFYYFASVVDVVAEFARDVVFVLLDYMIMPWRRIETSLSSCDSAFSNQAVAFVKVG